MWGGGRGRVGWEGGVWWERGWVGGLGGGKNNGLLKGGCGGDREYEGEKMKGSGRKGGKKRKKGEVHVHACALACGSAFAFSGCVHVRFDQ